MMQTIIQLGAGFLTGGLAVSTAWGLLWLVISLVGVSRGTCGARIALKSLAGTLVPLFLVGALVWAMGGIGQLTPWFGAGLMGLPVVLVGLWLRRAPDGRRAGMHLVAGVRQFAGELLGEHHGCGGCQQEHDHGTCQ